MASLAGAAGAIAETLELAQLPSPSDVIGPVLTTDEAQRVLIRVPRQLGGELASSLKAAAAIRSARKAADPVRIVLDPSAPF
jgi:primosomal protein N' (replication factor Y)